MAELSRADKDAQTYLYADEDDRKPKYLDDPSENGKEVSVEVGVPVKTDVWERVFKNNARVPSYILRFKAGQTPLQTHRSYSDTYRFGDYPYPLP